MSTQTTGIDSSTVAADSAPAPAPAQAKEYITYSKGVQTDTQTDSATSADEDDIRLRSRRRSSRRDHISDEEIRASLRKEIEDELRATQDGESAVLDGPPRQRFPLRTLNDNELTALTGSDNFAYFVERSSKVIERALDEEYDLLADYTRTSALTADDDEAPYSRNKKAHSLRETLQLFSDRHSRRRMVSDIQFSPHFNELLLTAYTKNPSAAQRIAWTSSSVECTRSIPTRVCLHLRQRCPLRTFLTLSPKPRHRRLLFWSDMSLGH